MNRLDEYYLRINYQQSIRPTERHYQFKIELSLRLADEKLRKVTLYDRRYMMGPLYNEITQFNIDLNRELYGI